MRFFFFLLCPFLLSLPWFAFPPAPGDGLPGAGVAGASAGFAIESCLVADESDQCSALTMEIARYSVTSGGVGKRAGVLGNVANELSGP